MSSHTSLKNVRDIGESLLSTQLEANLASFFQWATLGVGGFFNVSRGEAGVYGGDKSRLRPVDDPNYETGQVWEAFRQDWVWETGVEYREQPINVSGVYVDGAFQPASATGVYAHQVDYPRGRVVFDSPLLTTRTVQCEYSHRLFHWTTADCPWWREFQTNSFRVDDPHFLQQGSGAWSVLGQNRLQLPAVVVEAVPRTDRRPLQLGGGQIVRQDVLLHIVSETRWDMLTMHDIITSQKEKRLVGFDKNRLFAENAFPLDADGARVDEALMYPDLIRPSGEGGFEWKQIRLEDMRSFDHRHVPPLYYTTVRAVVEVDES